MNCELVFTIGEEEIRLSLDTDSDTPMTTEEIVQALLKDPAKRLLIADKIKLRAYALNLDRGVKVKDLLGKDGLQGNASLETLTLEFGVSFPLNVQARVLLVNNLIIKGVPIQGRVITANGEELFIIKNQADAEKLSNFLTVREKVRDSLDTIFLNGSAERELLNLCLEAINKGKKKKVENIGDMLSQYIATKSAFNKVYFTYNGELKSVTRTLAEITAIILDLSSPVEYNDDLINDIDTRKHFVRVVRDIVTMGIKKSELYTSLKLDGRLKALFDAEKITSASKFVEFFDSVETRDNVAEGLEIFYNGKNRWETLMNGVIFDRNPEYKWRYAGHAKDTIELRKTYRSLRERYGIEYDTIRAWEMIDTDYYGYLIYKMTVDGQSYFFTNRGTMSPESFNTRWLSEDDVKAFIEDRISTLSLRSNSFLPFKMRNKVGDDYEDEMPDFNIRSTTQSLAKGSIIYSLDIPIDATIINRITNANERELLTLDRTLKDFYDVVDGWNIQQETVNAIKSQLNTPEKAAVFICKINELYDDVRDDRMKEVAENIGNTSTFKAYYIETKLSYGGNYRYRVIPTDADKVDSYKKLPRLPVITLLSALQKLLEGYGVKVNLRNADELMKENGWKENEVNQVKAFVKNGEIFVNTTIASVEDPLHEFAHIILGHMKATPELRPHYELLMYKMALTLNAEALERLQKAYGNISQVDLFEEAFVSQFSRAIVGGNRIDGVFQVMQDATLQIFNTKVDDLLEFYSKKIGDVFTLFNSEIGLLLNGNSIDFDKTIMSRKRSNWINQQIKELKIIEECE